MGQRVFCINGRTSPRAPAGGGVAARLDPDEVGLRLVQTSIGPRPMRTVTFPGLCAVLIRSDTHQSTTRHGWIKTRACPALWWRELTSPPR
jgi:hypothetical protein